MVKRLARVFFQSWCPDGRVFLVGGWMGGYSCPGCISETVRCRKLILGGDIGYGV